MKTFFCIVLCLSVIYFSPVQSRCGWTYKQVEIKDSDVGKNIFSYDLTGEEFVGWNTTSMDGGIPLEKALSYFKITQSVSAFSIETTKKFKDLNKDSSYTGTSFLQITISIELKCNSGQNESPLLVKIINTNQNAPIFSQPSYVYSVPIPIMPKTDFSWFGDGIKATDIDFSTTSITFSIEPADFAVSSTPLENKSFQAVFSATKILRFKEDQLYTLTATDSGSPPQTASVQVTLKANTSVSVDSPSFSEDFYTFNYTTTELIPTSEAIVVNSNKPNEANFSGTGEYAKYFDFAFDKSTKTFTISTLSDLPLPEDAPSLIIITLGYTTDTTVNTVILITVVKDEIIPAFNQEYYQGTYDFETSSITWKEDIIVTGASTVTLSGGKADLFLIDEKTNKISPKNPLKTSDFNNSTIILTIKASSKTNDVHSTVIISLPTATDLKFDSAYYSASYSTEDNNGVVILNDDIVFEYGSDLSSITISVDNSYSKNFKFELDKEKWKVVVISPLDKSVLNANTEIAIPITAKVKEDSAKATAVLILKLPKKVEIKFGNSKYTAKYTIGTNLDDVSLSSDITIEGVEKNDITFSLDDFSDNFELVLNADSSGYKINVKKNIDDLVLKSNQQLIITITASKKDSSSSAKTVLVLDLPNQTSTITFKDKYYEAEYILDSNFNAVVDLVGSGIQISNADSSELLFSFGEFQNNFILEYNAVSSAYEIKVKQSLDASILASNTQLLITIEASKKDKSAFDSTILLLKLPEKTPSIAFKSKHYAAEYKVGSDSKATVTFNGDALKISGAKSSELQFSLDGFGENFEVVNNSDSSAYELKVTKNLDIKRLASKTQLIITITAFKVDGSAFDSTVVILQLPEKTSSINFESKHYAAQYIITDSKADVKLSGDGIKIIGANYAELEFFLGDFSDNFDITSADFGYKIRVKNKLNETILASKTELVITITASKKDGSAHDSTVLILELPKKSSVVTFERKHYAAEYILESDSKGSVKFSGDLIKISGNHSPIEFALENFSENFVLIYSDDDAAYKIKVNKNLEPEVLSNKQLVITITASTTDKSAFDTAVLILKLPDKSSSIAFESKHYSAEYILGLNSKASVRLSTEGIKILDDTSSKLKFTLEDYGDFFDLEYNEDLSGYMIIVTKNLDASVLALNSQLVITITAYKTDDGASDSTVLLLKLPEKKSSINFENKHYTAEYTIGSDSKSSVTLSVKDGIKILGAAFSELQVSFESYSKNFNLEYKPDISAYQIIVNEDLNESILAENEQLVIPIKAYKKDGTAFDSTVVILMLPEKSSLLAFESRHYSAEYIEDSDSKASVKMFGNIIKISHATSSPLTFLFEGYEENFDLIFNSTTSAYSVIVKKPLNKSVLYTNTQLAITITARSTSKLSASTVLALSLPSNETSSPAFENDYYVATYLIESSSEKHRIEVKATIKITDPIFAEEPLSFKGYEDYIVGSCDSKYLQCTVTLTHNLNSSILSSNSEILIPVIASNSNGVKKGKTVLLVKLPSAESTFTFSNQYYYGYYTIQKEDNGKATVLLNDTISFDNVDISDVTITLDQYSDEFSFTLDQKLEVKNNLNTEVLSKNSQLIISITAKKIGKDDYSKATLVLRLPDKTTMAFLMPQFSSKYVLTDDSASVVITDESGIQTTDNSVQVTLDSYYENFEVILDANKKWKIDVKKTLETSVFTKNSELRIIMTITKVGVNYGEAALIIKLPDVQFSKGFYIIEYAESNGVPSVDGEEIDVLNVNAKDIKLMISSDYDKYFYTTLNGNKWTVNVSQPLSAEIKEKYEILLPTIAAVRTSDNQKLATSTLVIKLPSKNATDAENAPIFTQFTYHGDYKTSEDSLSKVELTEVIGFTNSKTVEISSVTIEKSTSEYASNFKANKKKDGSVEIEVLTNLSQDVLEAESSIALTIIASSKQGNEGYAVLVINLPKAKREPSIHFEDEKILFSGSYKNGIFSLPDIPILTNSTDDSQISVEVSNDLEIDNKYFKATYSNKRLKMDVDDLPKDVLKKHSVIPLKLAIKDKTTGDTVYAVLNINNDDNSGDHNGDENGDSTSGDRKGLLVAVIILACLLIGLIATAVFVWYIKLRHANYSKMDIEPGTKKNNFFKKTTKQPLTPVFVNNPRRPTGLPINTLRSESPTEDASSDFSLPRAVPVPETDKKVLFDDHVQQIKPYEEENEVSSEGLQNVAARRSTQFVFGYPLEEGILDSPSERRESSDYMGVDPETKKSVLFDENVERMDIETVEDDTDDESDTSDSDTKEQTEHDVTNDDKKRTDESELNITLNEELPSQILKEIF